MKSKKNLLAIFISCLWFISPGIVSAGPANDPNISKESHEKKFANIPLKDNGDGTCTWDINTVHFDTLIANSCNFTKEDLIEINNSDYGITDEYVVEFNNECKKKVIYSLFENESIKKGNKRHAIEFTGYSLEGNQLTLYNDYDETVNGISEKKTLEKTCSVNFVKENDKDVKEIKKAKASLKNKYELSGLDSFNAVYHYGPIMDPNGFYTDKVVYKFSEFKDSLMKYKKLDYDVEFSAGGGTTPWDVLAMGWVHLSKNGITYDMKLVSFYMDLRLMVDKDLEGTPYEKAEKRLKEYFGSKVNIEVDKVNVEEPDGEYRTHVTIGEYTTRIMIIEVGKRDLDKYEVVAFDNDTDVKVETNSYEVPIDATINVKDVTEEITNIFDKKKFKVHSAYDIDVVKLTDGGFVKVIENGIDVYLPVTNRKIGEEVTVYHITDNGKGDGYRGIVVEVEGKQYVKFTTTHFSTYAIIEELEDKEYTDNTTNNNSTNIENPNTIDYLITSICILIISLFGLASCLIIKQKN